MAAKHVGFLLAACPQWTFFQTVLIVIKWSDDKVIINVYSAPIKTAPSVNMGKNDGNRQIMNTLVRFFYYYIYVYSN